MSKTARSFIWLLASYVSRIFIGLFTAGFLARILEPDGMGYYGLILAVAALFSSVVLNWTLAPLTRFGKEALERSGSWQGIWLKRLLLLLSSFGIVLIGLLPPLALVWAEILDIPWTLALSALILFGVLHNWLQLETTALAQIEELFSAIGMVPIVQQIIWLGCLTFLLLSQAKTNPAALLQIMWLINIVVCLTVLAFLFKRSGKRRVGEGEGIDFRIPLVRMVKYGLPVVGTTVAAYCSMYGDHWLIKYFLDFESLGYFQVAYQIFILINGFTVLLYQVFVPKIIREDVHGLNNAQRSISVDFPVMNVFWLIFLIISASLLPELFLIVFSEKYAPSVTLVLILMGGQVFSLLTSSYGPFFELQLRIKRSTLINMVMALVNLTISFILLPIMGLVGSAIGTAVSFWVGANLFILDQQRFHRTYETGQIFSGLLASSAILANIPLLSSLGARVLVAFLGVVIIVLFVRRKNYFGHFDFEMLSFGPVTPRRLLGYMFIKKPR